MTSPLAAFQSALGLALMGQDTCPIDPESEGFRFTATVRRSWCEGRATIAARTVLALVPEVERRRLVAEYVDAGGGLAMFFPSENAALLEFLAPRLPDPSHALSLCRMDQALARARLGAEVFAARPVPNRDRRSVLACLEHEAWGCLETAMVESFVDGHIDSERHPRVLERHPRARPEDRPAQTPTLPFGLLRASRDPRVEPEDDGKRARPEDRPTQTPGPPFDLLRASRDPRVEPKDDVRKPKDDEKMDRIVRDRIDHQAWGQIERSVRCRIERGPHAALVWFHADPESVLKALYGRPVPPVGDPTYPLLFAPGLPHLYRAATAEEVAFWTRLPVDDAMVDTTIERLLAEGVIVEAE